MSRLALIADVHGNLPALEAVIAAVGPVDGWICAGDIAGHMPLVDEVVVRLRELGAACVKGNHDVALLEGYGIPNSSAATRALQLQRQVIGEKTRNWLKALPETLDLQIGGVDIRVMHGGPHAPLHQKLYAVDDSVRASIRGHLLVVGHTHRPFCDIQTDYGVINPGAVGLPVDGVPVARAAVIDLPSREVTQIAVPYDFEALVEQMQYLGYDERYANCLRAGRWTGFSGPAPKVRLIIAGASIYGEMIAELVRARPDHELIGFVDDNPSMAGHSVAGAPILGTLNELADLATLQNVTEVAVGVGDNVLRARIASIVKMRGVRLARLIHPLASVSSSARLAPGVTVDAQAYVGPHCALEEGCSIWPAAVISHHSRIGAYAAVKPGAVIGGYSTISDGVKIEIGAVLPSYSQL